MSNILYTTQWSTNQQQQKEYIRRFEMLLNQFEARKTPIVFRSKSPPVQADWDTAWVTQSGLSLPIPPGTKLVWYDLTKQMMFTYTVPFDQLGGLQSSGQVVRSIDQSYDRPPMRLLATFDSADFINQFTGSPNQILSKNEPTSAFYFRAGVPLNPYVLRTMGLHDIMIIYRLRMPAGLATSAIFVLNFNIATSEWNLDATKQSGYLTLEEINGTLTRTDGGAASNGPLNLGGRSAYSTSVANAYAAGVIQMTHIGLAEDVGALAQDRLTFSGTHFGTRIDDTLGTTKFGFNIGGFYHWGQYPARGVSLGIENGTTIPNVGKAWMYGMFSKNTQELVEGQYL